MNNLFFACMDCKIYVDAGYRWALWALEETGVVTRGKPVSVASVLSVQDYWNPSKAESADWLNKEVLPSVRSFLEKHKRHRLVFGNASDFLPVDGEGFLDWMQIGFMPQLGPRYFIERLGLNTWEQVSNYVAEQGAAPWWWMLEWEGLHDKAREKFQQLIESRGVGQQVRCARACKRPGKSL